MVGRGAVAIRSWTPPGVIGDPTHVFSRVINCSFSNNWAARYGGAISNRHGNTTCTNSTFYGNGARNNGGAWNERGFDGGLNPAYEAVIQNCIFWANETLLAPSGNFVGGHEIGVDGERISSFARAMSWEAKPRSRASSR